MMKSTTFHLLALAAAALVLAGCSASVSDQDATAPTVPDDVVAPEDLPNEPVGSQISIAGDPATVCIYGDGYGTSVWAGSADTPCAFVEAAYATMTQGQDVDEVLHDLLITEITVTDPASGADRVLACAPRGEQLTTCVGTDGLAIHAY